MENVKIGRVYRHFKGNYYFVENVGLSSETHERVVIYKSLYDRDDSNIWVRPEKMFLDEITEQYKDKKVVLVTHGAVSQPIECYFNGMPSIVDFEHLEPLTLKNCEVRKYEARQQNKSEVEER